MTALKDLFKNYGEQISDFVRADNPDDPQQLDLFADWFPLIGLPPCGRGRGRCSAYVELGQHGEQYHCVKCDGAPIQFLRQQDSPPDDSGKQRRGSDD
jgi:hypothetical protein